MTAERWQQVQRVLGDALELPEDRRDAYVLKCCTGDPDLQAQVEELLESYRRANTFIEPPALAQFPQGWPDGLIGAELGPYKLVERIGEGGMGAVYRAERNDGEFVQQVAVKLVPPGLSSQELLRRLRSERQILASLNHRNIARLLDGGVSFDNQPYVVMEYIRGTRITEYCEKHALSVEQRLKLFQEICSAVSYAHQHLIVHRDIKPGNILVAEDGNPKLLDFGIAKILSPPGAAEDRTLTQFNPLTPDYASPEQLRGEPITTATDVYSLGVLLYELLTSRKPFQLKDKTPHKAMEIVCHTDPQRPSTAATQSGEKQSLRMAISPDLDAIVLKALRKEPEQRYASVEKFSEDIGNFLAGLPVGAREGNWRYITAKFVRRHQVGALMSAAVALLIVVGVSAVLWEAHVARVERARAERRFNDVRKLANSLIFEVHEGVAGLPGSTPVRKLIVQRAAAYLDSLAKDATGDAGLQVELANAYIRLAQVLGSTNEANLGDLPGAEQTFINAQRLLQSVLAKEPLRDDANGLMANSSRNLAYLYVGTRRLEKATEAAQKALAINQQLAARHPGNEFYEEALANAWYTLADVHAAKEDPATQDDRAKALAVYEHLLARHPDDPTKQRNLALAEKTTGSYLASHGSGQQAAGHYQRALELDQKRAKGDPQNPLPQLDVSFDLSEIGMYNYRLSNWEAALRNYQMSLEIRQRLSQADPSNIQLHERLIFMQGQTANTLRKMGRMEEAREMFQAAIDAGQVLIQAHPERKVYSGYDLGFAYMGLGSIKDASASHASRAQAIPLHKQACDDYAKAQDFFQPIVDAGKNPGPDRLKSLQELETSMRSCSIRISANE